MTLVKIIVGTVAQTFSLRDSNFFIIQARTGIRNKSNPEVDDKARDFTFSDASGQAGKLRFLSIRHSWSHCTHRGRRESKGLYTYVCSQMLAVRLASSVPGPNRRSLAKATFSLSYRSYFIFVITHTHCPVLWWWRTLSRDSEIQNPSFFPRFTKMGSSQPLSTY